MRSGCPSAIIGPRMYSRPRSLVRQTQLLPLKEWARPRAGIRQAAELGWKGGPIFQRPHLCLRIRVVVGDVRPRMRLGYAQVGQQWRDILGGHRPAAIGVQRALVMANPVCGTCFGNEDLGQRGRLAFADQKADHIAAEHVHNHLQLGVRPLGWAFEFGDSPAPQCSWSCGEQLRFGRDWAAQLIAPFPHFVGRRQATLHRAPRAQVDRRIKQGRVHLARRAILKARTIEHISHISSFVRPCAPNVSRRAELIFDIFPSEGYNRGSITHSAP